jgi:hypothetical protein
MLFDDAPMPRPNLLSVCEIITLTMSLSPNSDQGFMAGHKDYMSHSVSNPHVLCFTGCNQGFKCWMVLGRPQLLQFSIVIRYVSPTSPVTYGFGLLRLQCSYLHKNHLFIFWSTLVINPSRELMAPVVRIESNGLQALLTYDDATDMLSKVGWLGFIQSFKGFNIEVARAFTKILDGTKAKVGDIQLQVDEEFIAQGHGSPSVRGEMVQKHES